MNYSAVKNRAVLPHSTVMMLGYIRMDKMFLNFG